MLVPCGSFVCQHQKVVGKKERAKLTRKMRDAMILRGLCLENRIQRNLETDLEQGNKKEKKKKKTTQCMPAKEKL